MKKQCLCLNCLNSKIMIIGLCVELQIATEFAKLLRKRKDYVATSPSVFFRIVNGIKYRLREH